MVLNRAEIVYACAPPGSVLVIKNKGLWRGGAWRFIGTEKYFEKLTAGLFAGAFLKLPLATFAQKCYNSRNGQKNRHK